MCAINRFWKASNIPIAVNVTSKDIPIAKLGTIIGDNKSVLTDSLPGKLYLASTREAGIANTIDIADARTPIIKLVIKEGIKVSRLKRSSNHFRLIVLGGKAYIPPGLKEARTVKRIGPIRKRKENRRVKNLIFPNADGNIVIIVYLSDFFFISIHF
jgi:hypothetical protein